MTGTMRKWISPILYVLVPLVLLLLLAGPMREAVRQSESSAFLIVLAALAAVGLNWLVYRFLHRKHPSLPVFGLGVFCLIAVVVIVYDALPGYSVPRPTLAAIGGSLALAFLLLFSFWFASLRSRPAHVVAVGLRIVFWIILFFMAYQIIRDIEIGKPTRETWITAVILVAAIAGRNCPRIWSALRKKAAQRRATGLTAGRIVQIIGETHLDLDEDAVTLFHARVEYTVDGVPYETRAEITRYTLRKYGKEAFVGREIPVRYDPADPAGAVLERIRKPFPEPKKEKKA